ncbi:hypothetical protein [Pseudoduganella sp. R-34]|uniref:hypothetical protein n=1 Tax=Pseudoduganella sp. R-34 TaxID=3404062 RepID=UPI003CE9B651
MKDGDLVKISSMQRGLIGDDLEEQFKFLIRVIKEGVDRSEFQMVMNVLVDLADRQWETYELLPELTRRELGSLIVFIWDRNSLDSTEMMLGIIARLGLGAAMSYVINSVNALLDPQVKQAILDANLEFGENVDDPYSGM